MAKKRKKASTSKKSPKSKRRTRKAVPKVVTPEVLEAEIVDDSSESASSAEEGLDRDVEAIQSPTNLPSIPDTVTGLDPLKQYLREVSKYPMLDPEEELVLIKKLVTTGDVEAAKRLVTANLRLVVKIAMEYKNAYQNVMDLIQEGNVGLMKAVSKYDPTKGAKLSYFATWWIRSYILKYILDNFRLVKIGTTQAQKKLFYHLMREKERLQAQGLDAAPKLLADKLNVKEKDVREMDQRLSSGGSELSLNNPMKDSDSADGKSSYMDRLETGEQSPDDVLAAQELKNILTEGVREFESTLGEKERAVFTERLLAESPKTLQEVADIFGLTRERVRQIEQKVIEKLKVFYAEHMR